MQARLKAIPLFALFLFAALNGCSTNDTAPNTTAEVGQSLYQQLGGADGVTRLANQWGANIAGNSTLNQILDSVVIGEIQTGFTNDVMKASGMVPGTTTTLASALSGKGLNEMHINALSNTLREAGASLGINPTVMSTAASTVVEPAARSAAGM
ncbi:MAG TPA: hypothetical protein VFU38_02020 [Candidatus Krumholzibacteria bacterium]|nr:hypothetical protein [Candidatus Krumholzibacteria bacterium]